MELRSRAAARSDEIKRGATMEIDEDARGLVGVTATPTSPNLTRCMGKRSATTDRVLTIPNLITAGRLACIPIFVYLLFGRDNRAAAAWLLAVLGMTDWVDGWAARRLGQVSQLGKVLDPLA